MVRRDIRPYDTSSGFRFQATVIRTEHAAQPGEVLVGDGAQQPPRPLSRFLQRPDDVVFGYRSWSVHE